MEREITKKLQKNNNKLANFPIANSHRKFPKTKKIPLFLPPFHLQENGMLESIINEQNIQSSISSHILSIIKKINMGFNELTEHVKTAAHATQNAREYLKLLNHSFNKENYAEEINLEIMIKNILYLVYPHLHDQNTRCKINFTKDFPGLIYSNQHKLYFILLNLLMNAALSTFSGFINISFNLSKKSDLKIVILTKGKSIGQNYFEDEYNRFVHEYFNCSIHKKTLSQMPLTRKYLANLQGKLQMNYHQEGLKFTCSIPIKTKERK